MKTLKIWLAANPVRWLELLFSRCSKRGARRIPVALTFWAMGIAQKLDPMVFHRRNLRHKMDAELHDIETHHY